MHEPPTDVDGERYIPSRGGGGAAQQMPIRANVETIILPPNKVPRHFTGEGEAVSTGLAIPEQHALTIVSDGAVQLTLRNPGDEDIVLSFAACYRRVIPQNMIIQVIANAKQGVSFELWIEDLRAMEPWICAGEFRP